MTTRGTQASEPAQAEIKRIKGDGVVDVVVRWNVHEVTETDPETGESYTEWEYEESVLKDLEPKVPDSEYENWVSANSQQLIIAGKAKSGDLTTTELKKIIDRETGKKIDSRVHEAAGLQEQIGILRYSITELYNRLGEAVPAELETLNTIANEEIQSGQDRKTNL